MIELILQRFCAGANNRFATAQQRWNKVGESLAGTSTSLHHQLIGVGNSLGYGLSHPTLAGTWLEAR